MIEIWCSSGRPGGDFRTSSNQFRITILQIGGLILPRGTAGPSPNIQDSDKALLTSFWHAGSTNTVGLVGESYTGFQKMF